LNQRVTETLNELDRAVWFAHVGVEDTDSAVVLKSWGEAIKHCTSSKWKGLRLEAANQYRERLVERSRERFRQWNKVVDQVKRTAEDMVRKKVKKVMAEHKLPKTFLDTVQWDILHLCMEAEFADVYPPGFYASQGYWYINGHFPCGWQGEFPEGILVIY
jgi:hypothetical protein